MIKEVTVPDIGSYAQVEIIEVAVKNGAQVNKEDTLITLETEKASMDIPAPFTGVIKEMKVKIGDRVSKGDLILLIETQEEKTVEQAQQAAPAAPIATAAPATSEPAAPVAAVSEAPAVREVMLPDIGNYDQVEIIEVAAQAGAQINKEDTLITLETEKASMDIPSPFTGVVKEMKVKVGDRISKGALIALIETQGGTTTPKAATTQAAPAVAPIATAAKPEPVRAPATQAVATAPTTSGFVHAGPATRKLARELGVDLTMVRGNGHKGRIMTTDVHAYVKEKLAQVQSGGASFGIEKAPEVDFTQFGEIEVKPMGRIKKWTAKNLHRNWVTIPHVTQFDEADISELEIFRQENKQAAQDNGIRLTPLAFIMKASVSALKHYPQFNASLSANGTDVIFKKYFHIGFAVDTPNGLVVPVVRDVDNKGLFDLAREIGELSAKAREGKLSAQEMQGSCFTITSLGGIGGTAFTPIINAPDLAILGVSKSGIKPVYQDNQWVPRTFLPLSLSYDHRVIDGVEAAKFTVHLVEQLQDIRKLLL